MNLGLAVLSGFSGIAMTVLALFTHDLQSGFSGAGALGVAILLYQMSDMRERMQRLESLVFDAAKKGITKP